MHLAIAVLNSIGLYALDVTYILYLLHAHTSQVKSSRVHIIPARISLFVYLHSSLLKDWPPATFRILEQHRTDRPKATLQYCPGTGSSQMLQSNQNSKYAKFN